MEAAMNMEEKEQKASLPFFGIPRLIPYIRKYRKTLLIMIICGLGGTGVDLVLPLLQRYALNHYVAFRTLDTLPSFFSARSLIISPPWTPGPRRSGLTGICALRPSTICRSCPSAIITRTPWATFIPAS